MTAARQASIDRELEQSRTINLVAAIVAAVLLGLLVQVSQARLLGGWSSLLAVGEDSRVRGSIAQELPTLVLVDGGGHDGQSVYAIGTDPWLRGPTPEIEDLSYRYRRILLPALGSGFGLLSGEALLLGVTAFTLLGYVATTGAVAAIAQRRRLPQWAAAAGLLNIGLWLSLQNTTPDALAMGLGAMGLMLALRDHHRAAAIMIALSALAKETHAIIGLSLAAWSWFHLRNRRATLAYLLSPLPLAAWSLYLAFRLKEGTPQGIVIDWPFKGLLEAVPMWGSVPGREAVLTILSMVVLILGARALVRARDPIWPFLILPWMALALISSHWVWDFGNNSLRVLAPVLTFAVLALLDESAVRRRRASPSDSEDISMARGLS